MTFQLNWKWQASPYDGNQPKHWQVSFAELSIWVNNLNLTRHYNKQELTDLSKQDAVLLPLYEVAEWLCLHWWHLLYESNTANGRFEARHSLAAAGGGFGLPDLQLWPVGDQIRLNVEAHEPYATECRFFEQTQVWLPKNAVEVELARLIREVVQRLEQNGISSTPLQEYWHHLRSLTPEEQAFMQAVAHLGIHPEEAPDELVTTMHKVVDRLGFTNALELFDLYDADSLQTEAEDLFHAIAGISLQATGPQQWDWLQKAKQTIRRQPRPWQQGYALADAVRNSLLKEAEPLPAEPEEVAEALSLSLKTSDATAFPMQVDALSAADEAGPLHILFPKRHLTSRKFHLGRLIGEYLLNGHSAIHLATRSYMPSQQTNRAFAAELLIPARYLKSLRPSGHAFLLDQQVEEIASQYQVSERMVYLHALNHGLIQKEADLGGYSAGG